MKESDKIELRSEEMQDILARPPHILIRSGITVISAVVLLLIIGSMFFKYPDLASGEIVITTENPPVWLTAQTSGKIKEWNCKDKQIIFPGQILAVIENSAQTQDVLQLKKQLQQCRIADSIIIIPPELKTTTYELGMVQNTYSAFLRATTEYDNFLLYNTIEQEKAALNLQISGHKHYSSNLQKQWQLKQKEKQLAKTAYEREQQLYVKGVISKAEMEAAESAYLNIRQSLQQLQTNQSSDAIESDQLQASLSKLDVQYQNERIRLLSGLKTTYSELISTVENWEQMYVLTAPLEGTVTFHAFWKDNQFVGTGEKVLAIVPRDAGDLVGRIQIPVTNSGKIKSGQRINIKVNGYPYMEYGMLQALVRSISLIPEGNIYLVEVALPQGLCTGAGKTLNFTGELTGQAEIITDERSLFSKIVSPVAYLLKNYFIQEDTFANP
jgi:HlyD family secretion protein